MAEPSTSDSLSFKPLPFEDFRKALTEGTLEEYGSLPNVIEETAPSAPSQADTEVVEEAPVYRRVQALPDEEEAELVAQIDDHLKGLSDAGWGEITFSTLTNRIENGLRDEAPRRSEAPGKGSTPLSKTGQLLTEWSGWNPALATVRENIFTQDEMYRPATSLPYYGQRRGFGRLPAWIAGREGFTGVREGEEQEKRPEGLEDAQSAREIIREAEAKIVEVGKKVVFEDFEPLMITPGALAILRLDLQRMNIPKEQVDSIPLEYVAPLWKKIRNDLAWRQEVLSETEKGSTETIKGTARVLGQEETKDISAELPTDRDRRELALEVIQGKAQPSTKDALKNAQIRPVDQDMLQAYDAYQQHEIGSYKDLDRERTRVGFKPQELEDPSLRKDAESIPLVYIKHKGWNIDLNAIHSALLWSHYRELTRNRLNELERGGLTPNAAMEALYSNTEARDERGEEAAEYATRRITTFLSNRNSTASASWYTQKSTAQANADFWASDAPAPASPFSPIMRPDQLMKFMGPWGTAAGLTFTNVAAAGDIYKGETPASISTSKLHEYLRSAPTTVAGSWLTSWNIPESNDPQIIWESLWDHWGSKEHYELMTTGRWDITERFYDIGDTTADLLEKAFEMAGAEGYAPVPDSYSGKKVLGALIGVPLMVIEPDPLSFKLAIIGKGLRPLIRGVAKWKNQSAIRLLEDPEFRALSPADRAKKLDAEGYKDIRVLRNKLLGAKLESSTADKNAVLAKRVFGAGKDVKEKGAAVRAAEEEFVKNPVPENQAAIHHAKQQEWVAEDVAISARFAYWRNLQAQKKVQVKVEKEIAKDLGPSQKSLKDYPKAKTQHDAARDHWEELLKEPVLEGGKVTKGEVWLAEKTYRSEISEAIKIFEDLVDVRKLELDEAPIPEFAQIAAKKNKITQLKQVLTELRKTGADSVAEKALIKRRKKLKEATDKWERLHQLSPEDKLAKVKKAGITKPLLSPQERWDIFLREPGQARLQKTIAKLTKELEEEAAPIKGFAGRKEIATAEQTLLREQKELEALQETLIEEQTKRWKKGPKFKEVDLNDMVALVEEVQKKIKGMKPGDIPGEAAGRLRILEEETEVLKKELKQSINDAQSIRNETLAGMGIKVTTAKGRKVLKEIVTLGKELDDTTLELRRIMQEAKVNRVETEFAHAGRQIEGLSAARKALETPPGISPSAVRLAELEDLKRAEADAIVEEARLKGLDDGILDEIIRGKRMNEALIQRGGRYKAGRLERYLTNLPQRAITRIAGLIGRGYSPIKAVEAVIEDVPKYARYQSGGINLERVGERPAIVEAGWTKGGAKEVDSKELRGILEERYGKRVVDEFIAESKEAEENIIEFAKRLGPLDPALIHRFISQTSYVEDKLFADLHRVLERETAELLPNDLILMFQNVERRMADRANRYWQKEHALDLMTSLSTIRETIKPGRFLFKKGAAQNKQQAEALRDVQAATEHLATRSWEELDTALLKRSIDGQLAPNEVIDLFVDFWGGKPLPMARGMGETFMNTGVNLWDSIRFGLLKNTRWKASVGEGDLKGTVWMGEEGLKFTARADAALAEEGITFSSVIDEVTLKLADEDKYLAAEIAQEEWTLIRAAKFSKLLDDEIEANGWTGLFGEDGGASEALHTLSKAWIKGSSATSDQPLTPVKREALLKHAYILTNTATDFPTFMRTFSQIVRGKTIRPQLEGGPATEARGALSDAVDQQATDLETHIRAWHNATAAGLQSKVEDYGLTQAGRVLGPSISRKDAVAMNAILTGEFTKESGAALDRALGLLNEVGIPINRVTVLKEVENAAGTQRKIEQMMQDPLGMNAFAATDLLADFKVVMGKINKEMENAFTLKEIDKIANALPDFAGSIVQGAYAGLRSWFQLWRQSVVTGLYIANPRHWTNTSVGDFGQMWEAESLSTSAKLSFQNLPVNIPFVGRTLQDAMILKAKEGDRLGTYVAALLNPHLQEFWNMPTAKAMKTYIRGDSGVLHNVQDLRIRAATDGILSTFEAERGLIPRAKTAALTGKETPWQKFRRKSKDWNTAIAHMMIYGQQRQRTAFWLEKVVNEGLPYKEAQRRTFNALYDWKHGIADWERQYLTQLMTFWRWWSLAARRHADAILEPMTKPTADVLKGNTRLARIRSQIQLGRSIPDLTSWEDETKEAKTQEEEWELLMNEMPPFWSAERLMGAQRPMTGAASMELEDISGKLYTHSVYVGPPLTSAEMHSYYLYMTSGVLILAAQIANAAGLSEAAFGEKIITPRGELAGETLAGVEFMLKPLSEMLLPLYKAFTEEQLGGFRTSWRTRPVSLGEAVIIDKLGKEFFNMAGADIHLDNNNRYRVNSNALQLFRTLPFIGSQAATIVGNVYTAVPDMREDMAKGMMVMLGNFLGIRKVPTNPEDELKWQMRKIEQHLKEEVEAAKLPMERDRWRDSFTQ